MQIDTGMTDRSEVKLIYAKTLNDLMVQINNWSLQGWKTNGTPFEEGSNGVCRWVCMVTRTPKNKPDLWKSSYKEDF